ncbi:MAG: class cytochrome c [Ramlibacter sp.]|jgi:cytochrome c556|nr:class cytochrome c [Ramlibacter sp.]
MKIAASLVFAATAIVMATPASAQFAKPEDAVKYRQSALSIMGTHFGRIGAMTSGKAPYDAKAAVDSAQIVATMSRLPWPAFTADTEKVTVQTRAKPEIWTNNAKFKDDSEQLQNETGKLLAAAQTNNLDNLKAAFASTGKACKSCHDDFRKDVK